jgi:hypothetical protein
VNRAGHEEVRGVAAPERNAEGERGPFDSGNTPGSLQQPPAEFGNLGGGRPLAPEVGHRHQQPGRLIAEIHRADIAEAADEEARTDQQEHRERRLRHQQRGSQSGPRPASFRPPP